jgi:hypothetical protein
MDDRVKENALAAIAVMTAAVGEPEGPRLLTVQLLNEWGSATPDGFSRVVQGFIQLCTLLLGIIQAASGIAPEKALQIAAGVTITWDDSDE